jgi:NhaP-type Na+/H+ or K+/H+ antiporter
MGLLLAFGALLVVAVLLSGIAHRTVLSTASLFLVGGYVLGDGGIGAIHVRAGDPLVESLARLALFTVLLTDGMRNGIGELRQAWRLPGRALVLGLPLALLATAGFAHWLVGLAWLPALLLAAALSPTDPVFAAAIVGRDEIPFRLRNLLNVESGLNDGLALPLVVVLLAVEGSGSITPPGVAGEVAGGIAIGVAIATGVVALARLDAFSATPRYEPLTVVAIGCLVFAVADLTGGNLYLAAFSAGVAVASTGESLVRAFERFGELVGELFKLGALLVFGALVSPSLVMADGAAGLVFAALVLFAARPLAIAIALIGTGIDRRERLAAAWFGPKGFASVVYGLLILDAGLASSDHLFHLIALVVGASILLHSSTDVLVARTFDRPAPSPPPSARGPGAGSEAPEAG